MMRHRKETEYIKFNERGCEACWKCIGACPKGVIDQIGFWFHKHARLANPDACIGCLKCVKACEYGAMTAKNN